MPHRSGIVEAGVGVMAARHDVEAVIIGGGIGGLAAAVALRRAGRDVVVCERAGALDPAGAGLSLWPNAVKALDRLGLGAAVRALGAPEQGGGIRNSRGGLLAPLSTDGLARRHGAPTVVVHRADLQQVLRDALPDGAVRLGASCEALAQDAAGVDARFADGSCLRAALVVGADGLRSVVRAALFAAAPPRYRGYTAWRAVTTFPHDRLRPGESWGCGLEFGQAALAGGHVYWFAAANMPEGAPDGPGGRKRDVLERFGAWHDPIPAIIATTDEGAILRNDIYDRPPLKRWSMGRITLLGDAAHPMAPNLGQGACQALEDAVVLDRCLREDGDIAGALRRYERERAPRANMIARQSRLIERVAQWDNPLACYLRDATLRALPGWLLQQSLDRVVGYDVH